MLQSPPTTSDWKRSGTILVEWEVMEKQENRLSK